MFSASTEVVGLIELDRSSARALEHPLAPAGCVDRRPTAPANIARVIDASDDDDVITADLRQLKRELRAELAFVLARLKRSLRVDA